MSNLIEDKNFRGHAAMLGACITFGLLAPVSKSLFGTGLVSAYALTMMRMGGGAVVFWIASLFTRREHAMPPRDLLLFFFASLLGIVLNQGTYVLGVSKTSPIDASVVTTTTDLRDGHCRVVPAGTDHRQENPGCRRRRRRRAAADPFRARTWFPAGRAAVPFPATCCVFSPNCRLRPISWYSKTN